MRAGAFRRKIGLPEIHVNGWLYNHWVRHRPQVRVPYDVTLMFGRFYVNGCRIRFHIDGSMATVLTSYYCVNERDGEYFLVLMHVVQYWYGDDDGVNQTEIYAASILHRCAVAVSFPIDWQYQVTERLSKRDYLREKFNIDGTTNYYD